VAIGDSARARPPAIIACGDESHVQSPLLIYLLLIHYRPSLRAGQECKRHRQARVGSLAVSLGHLDPQASPGKMPDIGKLDLSAADKENILSPLPQP
jgi:hypothetical protein